MHVLFQPGWQNSNPQHWQSLWEQRLGGSASRIPHTDWEHPKLNDWIRTAEEAIAAVPGRVVLACHSLGCVLTAYLAHRDISQRIAAALLVAPSDVDRPECPAEIRNFAPIPMLPMPFPTIMVASDDDPYCPPARARELAHAWGSEFHLLRSAAHVSASSGYGDWHEGFSLLQTLRHGAEAHTHTPDVRTAS